MKCDFCDGEAVLTSGYHYCKKCVKKQDRIAIHIMISDMFPSIPIAKIHELCSEMFGTEDYHLSLIPKLYEILPRGPTGTKGWYIKAQPQYMGEVFLEFLREKHLTIYEKVVHERVERFY